VGKTNVKTVQHSIPYSMSTCSLLIVCLHLLDSRGREWCLPTAPNLTLAFYDPELWPEVDPWGWPLHALARGPLVPICIKLCSFIFKILRFKFGSWQMNERTHGLMDKRTGRLRQSIVAHAFAEVITFMRFMMLSALCLP